MNPDPISKFQRWYAATRRSRAALPDACALATADRRGRPSLRFVLLKEADSRGFVFYTHSDSAKGRELKANPRAALAFYWDKPGRQVRISGPVSPVSKAEADAYWASRPRLSQIGAWASRQSRPLRNRGALLAAVSHFREKFEGGPVPRLPTWKGYRIQPQRIEFWTRKSFRMHHRELFVRKGKGWRKVLLQP